MNSLPKTVTRESRGCDLNPSPSVAESSTLTTQQPSRPCYCHININEIAHNALCTVFLKIESDRQFNSAIMCVRSRIFQSCIFQSCIFLSRIFQSCIFPSCIFRSRIFQSCIFPSCIFQSCIFQSCNFSVVRFPVLTSGPSFSGSASAAL